MGGEICVKCPNCHYEVADSVLVCPVCFSTIHDNSQSTLIHQSDQPNINNNNAPQVQKVVVKTINTNKEVNKPQVVQVQQVVVKEENDIKVSDLVVDEPVNNGRTEVELIDKKNKKVYENCIKCGKPLSKSEIKNGVSLILLLILFRFVNSKGVQENLFARLFNDKFLIKPYKPLLFLENFV